MTTTSKAVLDADAININLQLNDVARAIEIGGHLQQILERRFNKNVRVFRHWARHHVDRDLLTIARYLFLYRHSDAIREQGIIRLSEAYKLLGIDGSQVPIGDSGIDAD